MIKKSILLLALSILLSVNTFAQFEGLVMFNGYDVDDPESTRSKMHMTITKDRILIMSDRQVNVMMGLNANGILVRNDQKDVVLMTGGSDALRLQQSDLDNFFNLLQRFQGAPAQGTSFDWDANLDITGRTKTIHGYKVEEIVMKNMEDNTHISVWLTDQIKVNWGLLIDTWNRFGHIITEEEVPIDLFVNRNSFPLLIEYYRGDQLRTIIETTSLSEARVAPSAVSIPANVTLMGLSDMMMRMLRGQR
jgi:hypothetical protein